MKKIVMLAMLCSILNQIIAQQKNRPVFNSYTAAGVQSGQSDPAITVETINGIRTKNWFTGIGVGYSAYRYRTIPVFADARFAFGKRRQFFINGDAGYNLIKPATYEEDAQYYDVKYKGGIFFNSGIGIALQPTKKHSFYFQLDYGVKQVRKVVNEFIWIDFPPYNRDIDHYTTYKYNLTTVSLKMGFKF